MLNAKLDLHCHTSFSFDSDAVPEEVCESAIKKGIKHLAITDHCDYDCILNGLYDVYDAAGAKRKIIDLREKYRDRLDIIYGIELGGAHAVTKEAQTLVEKQGFDFVLGSLHNLRDMPDFFFMDYRKMPKELICSLVHRSILELKEIAALPFIDSIAHITYPLRYIAEAGIEIDLSDFVDDITELFDIIIKTDKALEINTSPYRKGITDTMPQTELIRLYKKCGGKRITVGSDSHTPDGVGDGVLPSLNILKDLGFESVTLYNSNGKADIPISALI